MDFDQTTNRFAFCKIARINYPRVDFLQLSEYLQKHTTLDYLRKVLLTLTIIGWLVISFSWASEEAQAMSLSPLVPSLSLPKEQPLAHSVPETKKLPPNIKSAVLRDVSQRTSQNVAAFRITEAEEHTWSDSCLGLSEPDQFCAQVLTPGWQVLVTDGKEEWVYRTDASGNLVKLEESSDK
jgi:hypothetical protein